MQQVVATIRLKCPDQAERMITLTEGESVRIGRDSSNDIVMADPAVSRVHATVSASSSGVVIADNKSTNGTFVNGKRISMRDVHSGDLIDIGSSKLSVDIRADKAIRLLSGTSNSRAMTAQLKPVSVTVLVGTLLVKSDQGVDVPADHVSELWLEHSERAVHEFKGLLDKQIGNHLVALWMGTEAKEMAGRAVRAAQRIKLLTGAIAEQISGAALEVKLIVSSGQGLKGLIGPAQKPGSNSFTILGDPINTAFTLEEGVPDLTKQIIICPSTAGLIKSDFQMESSRPPSRDGEVVLGDIFLLA